MLIHVIVQSNRPVDTARVDSLPTQLGILFLGFSQQLGRVLALVVLGNRLGSLALEILRLRVATARGQESTTLTGVGGRGHVHGIVAARVVDVEVSTVGGEEHEDGKVAFRCRLVSWREFVLVESVRIAAVSQDRSTHVDATARGRVV